MGEQRIWPGVACLATAAVWPNLCTSSVSVTGRALICSGAFVTILLLHCLCRATAELAKAFRMKVVALRRNTTLAEADKGVVVRGGMGVARST